MQENAPLDSPNAAPVLKRRNWTQFIFFGLELLFLTLIVLGALLRLIPKPGFDDIGEGLSLLAMGVLDVFYPFFSPFVFGSRGWVRHLGSVAVGMVMATALNSIMPLFGLESVWNDRAIFGNLLGVVAIALVVVKLKQDPARWHEGNFYKHIVARLAFFIICLIFSIVLYVFTH